MVEKLLQELLALVDAKGSTFEQGVVGTLISSYEFHTNDGKVWSEVGGIWADYIGSLFSPVVGAIFSSIYVIAMEVPWECMETPDYPHWGCHH